MILAIFAISKSKFSSTITESFIDVPRKPHIYKQIVNGAGQTTNLGLASNTYPFFSTPNFQSNISPRMFSGDYNATIKYNMPSRDNLAVPSNPMDYANRAKENYTKEKYGCTSGNVGNVSNSKLTSVNVSDLSSSNVPTSLVSLGDMTTVGIDGNAETVHVFDNYIYANAKSRLRSQSDQIRGDLPIVPCKRGIFDVSVNLATDLNVGALAVMGGNGETAMNTAKLVYAASGNSNTTLGGVNMANDFKSMGNEYAEMNVQSFM
jgi:hypothetical protein